MSSCLPNKKGVAIFMVLATIMIVVVLANVVLAIISNQSRITRHEVGRVQAYYAAQAGLVYAMEKLRNGSWTYVGTNSCPNGTPCTITDSGFAPYILSNQVSVIFCDSGSNCSIGTSTVNCNPPSGINFCVQSFVNYTYNP